MGSLSMAVLSGQEVITKLFALGIRPASFGRGLTAVEADLVMANLGGVKEAEDDNGAEYRKVILFKEHGVFLLIEGFYSSYDGTDWESDYKEVRPTTETITTFK